MNSKEKGIMLSGNPDIENAIAWMEYLAARQGASIGFVTKSAGERVAEPADWIKN